MRAFALAALLSTAGCQTKTQCGVGIGVGTAIAVVGLVSYDSRNEDPGTAIIPFAVVAGGLVAVFSAINLVALSREED